MRVPSRDHAGLSTASGRTHSTTVSPGPSTGRTCSELSVESGPRRLVNASRRPSGDQAGRPSLCSPDVTGNGATEPSTCANHTALR